MHRAWLLADITEEILNHVVGEGSLKKGLVSLALVNRTLHEIAIDHIWYHIPTLRPLVDCFPGDLWCRTDQVFLRDILPSDWTDWRKYACRVRSFGESESNKHVDVTPATYRALFQAAGANRILPNIHTIFLNYDDAPGRIFFAGMLCGDHLTSFKIQFNHLETHAPGVSCILRCYSKLLSTVFKCTSLQKLDLCPILQEPGMNELSRVFSHLPVASRSLRHLTIGPLQPLALLTVAQLPHIETLDLTLNTRHVKTKTIGDFSMLQAANHTFPSLKSLYLRDAQSISICSAFLRTVSSKDLYSVSFKISDKSGEDGSVGWADLFEILEEKGRATIRKLSFVVSDSYQSVRPPSSRDPLNHLLRISNLREYTFVQTSVGRPPIPLGDSTVERMALAWPQITIFVVQFPRCSDDDRVTMRGMAHFRDHCPHLKVLTLPFDDLRINRETTR